MYTRFIITALIILLFDLYVFKGLWVLTKNNSQLSKWIIYGVYWIASIVLVVQLVNIFTTTQDYRIAKPEAFVWWSGVFFTVFFAKLFFVFFHFADDVFHLFRWSALKLSDQAKPEDFRGELITRSRFLTQIGAGVSLAVLGLYSYGITRGKFAFRIMSEKLQFTNLPKAFDGTKIVQISDLHLGTFANQFDRIIEVVQQINDLEPDYIFFTGDMVNVHSDEAEPWIPVFNKLRAKKGMFSIFGNHDYADYGNYTEEEKTGSINRLKEIQQEMGFRLLEDEHLTFEENGEKISLIGTHNWGKGFHQVGRLEDAMEGIDDENFKVLLSHDPTQWEEKVMDKLNIDLTLSGHTHGMQMGLEIPRLNIKFSPISLRYRRWAGLYQSSDERQRIYINRGFGVLGFPGRVGMPPEITVIELQSADNKA